MSHIELEVSRDLAQILGPLLGEPCVEGPVCAPIAVCRRYFAARQVCIHSCTPKTSTLSNKILLQVHNFVHMLSTLHYTVQSNVCLLVHEMGH